MQQDATEQIRRLQQQIVATRKERQAAQRRVLERGAVEVSLSRTVRDRSALTSPEVTAAQERVQRLLDELVEVWDGVDRVWHLSQPLRSRYAVDFAGLDEAFAAEAQVRDRFGQEAAAAGLALPVPVSAAHSHGPAGPRGGAAGWIVQRGGVMARGKHARRAGGKRTHEAQAQIAALETELAEETAALDALREQEEQVDRLREELATEKALRAGATSPEVEALAAEAEVLERALRAARAADQRVDRAWDRVYVACVQAAGGGVEGYEAVARAMGIEGHLIGEANPAGLRTEQLLRLQTLRGDRRSLPPGQSFRGDWSMAVAVRSLLRERHYRAWDAAGIPAVTNFAEVPALTKEQQTAREAVEKTANALLAASPRTLNADAIHAWHPIPWLAAAPAPAVAAEDGASLGAGRVLTALGSLIEDGPASGDAGAGTSGPAMLAPVIAAGSADDGWPLPTQALAAATRARLTASGDLDILLAQWRDHLRAGAELAGSFGAHHDALHSGPRHPRPGRAASLRHLYALAASGSWSRAIEAMAASDVDRPVLPSPDDEVVEHNNATAAMWGRLAVALHCAAPFWLPQGQTYSFANSEPLAAEDLADILLPFPQVFLAFAEPLRLPSTGEAVEGVHARLSQLDNAATLLRTSDRGATIDALLRAPGAPLVNPLPLAAALDARGARVEGLILLADSLGRVEDTFGWCLSIPSGAGGTLGRHVVPASLSATRHRHLVENLIAVAAWGDWHAPDEAALAAAQAAGGRDGGDPPVRFEDPDPSRTGDIVGAGGVHVLNVSATVRADGGQAGEPGRHMAPHVRRGHWRRQRFGPARQHVKRIRIAPVLVNAHRGTIQARVYQIPVEPT